MNRSEYSYLDFTVMPFLRRKVISSDAAILFDRTLSKVLWANAVGTELFGGSGIYSLLNTELSERHPLVRQLKNAARQITDSIPIERGFRVARGLKSDLMPGELSRISLPNGDDAILLVFAAQGKAAKIREHELAVMAVDALEDFADAAAIVDEYGLVLASSPGFDTLDIEADTLEALIAIVAREDDRLVKRKIETASGKAAAAGLGRIRDVPGRFLIVIADTSNDEDDNEAGAELPQESNRVPGLLADNDAAINPEGLATENADFQDDVEGPYRIDDDHVMPPWLQADDGVAGEDDARYPDREKEAYHDIESTGQTDDHTPARVPLPERMPHPENGSLLDRWYFSDDSAKPGRSFGQAPEETVSDDLPDAFAERETEEHIQPQDDLPEHLTADDHESLPADKTWPKAHDDVPVSASDDHFPADPYNPVAPVASAPSAPAENALPQRFAFSIDRFQVVQSVSPDLAKSVGVHSGDIAGKHWNAIARERGFDENEVILRLLEKADTWSGRSVLWPIDDTDMVVPVDLAALPVFDRERNFDGFRGFGVIRLDDTIVDPAGTGLRLREMASGDDLSIDEPARESETASGAQVWDTQIEEEDAGFSVEDNKGEPTEPDLETEQPKGGNVFQLPRSPQATARDRFTQTQPAQKEQDQLTGKEQQAFSEISRSLSTAADNDDVKISQDSAKDNDKSLSLAPFAADTLLETLPVPLFVYQTQKTLFANDALLELTGYGSTEEIAKAGGVDALIGERGPSDSTDIHGSKLRLKDGRQIDVRSRLTSISWRGEKALCLTFAELAKAPIEEKAALDMVRVSELENILETAADGILVIDENGKIESLNASGEALFGRSQKEVIGQSFGKLFATESRQALESYIRDLNQPGVSGVMNQGQQVIGLESGGGMIPLFATIGKIGSSNRYCAVLRDLTQWKKNEEELVEAKRNAETANDQKSEFLARISHEIREPLTAIIGFSDVMIEERFGKIDNERYREYLKDINRSGIHVLDLVNDLLDISKIEAGKLELSYEAVDLNQLAAETVALLQPQANNKRILIRTSLSRAVPKVVADARSIRQIILNLVSNAINHSPKNSQVIVSTTYEENSEVGLRIRDTGKGMTQDEIRMALQPFTQVGSSREGKQGGTGLGLPLTKALIEANRAFFELESTPGEGTIAHIQFPSQRVLAD